MTQRSNSADNSPLVSRTKLYAAVAKGLRNEIGRGKRYTVKEVSNHTGVPDRMIECAKVDPDNLDWRPLSFEYVMSLSSFLGPVFTSEWLSAAQQGAFWLPEGDEMPPGELAADNADDNATITRAARDGVFDQKERKELRPVGLRMVSRGAQLVALEEAA